MGRWQGGVSKSHTRLYPAGESCGLLSLPPTPRTAATKKAIDGRAKMMKRVMAM